MHSLFIPFLLQFLFPPFLKFPTGNDPFRPNCPSCSNSPDKIFTQIGNMETQAIFFFSDTSLHTYKTSASFLFMYSLSTSLYGCIAPYIVIDLLDFLSIAFSSLLFQCSRLFGLRLVMEPISNMTSFKIRSLFSSLFNRITKSE